MCDVPVVTNQRHWYKVQHCIRSLAPQTTRKLSFLLLLFPNIKCKVETSEVLWGFLLGLGFVAVEFFVVLFLMQCLKTPDFLNFLALLEVPLSNLLSLGNQGTSGGGGIDWLIYVLV